MSLTVISNQVILNAEESHRIPTVAGHTYNLNVTFGATYVTNPAVGWYINATIIGGGAVGMHIKVITDTDHTFTIKNYTGIVGGVHYSGFDQS